MATERCHLWVGWHSWHTRSLTFGGVQCAETPLCGCRCMRTPGRQWCCRLSLFEAMWANIVLYHIKMSCSLSFDESVPSNMSLKTICASRASFGPRSVPLPEEPQRESGGADKLGWKSSFWRLSCSVCGLVIRMAIGSWKKERERERIC